MGEGRALSPPMAESSSPAGSLLALQGCTTKHDKRSGVSLVRLRGCRRRTVRDSVIDDGSEAVFERVWCFEGAEASGLDIGDAEACSFAEGLDPRLFFGLAAFDQAQPLTQDLAGVLVPAGRDETCDQLRLVNGENYVAGRHLWTSGSVNVRLACYATGSLLSNGRGLKRRRWLVPADRLVPQKGR